MRLKNIKKIRGKNVVDTSFGLNGCAECKARILSMSAGLGAGCLSTGYYINFFTRGSSPLLESHV